MTTQLESDELAGTLAEFEALQTRESEILRVMRSDLLDEVTLEKDRLCAKLRDVSARIPPTASHRAALERVRQQAALNQLLLVHARDTVRTILSQVTGAPLEGLPHSRRSFAQEGVRLNVRV